jgi:hypothetical protein
MPTLPWDFQDEARKHRVGAQTRCPHCGVLFKGIGDGVGQAQRAIDDLTA